MVFSEGSADERVSVSGERLLKVCGASSQVVATGLECLEDVNSSQQSTCMLLMYNDPAECNMWIVALPTMFTNSGILGTCTVPAGSISREWPRGSRGVSARCGPNPICAFRKHWHIPQSESVSPWRRRCAGGRGPSACAVTA